MSQKGGKDRGWRLNKPVARVKGILECDNMEAIKHHSTKFHLGNLLWGKLAPLTTRWEFEKKGSLLAFNENLLCAKNWALHAASHDSHTAPQGKYYCYLHFVDEETEA